jgi:hypothetical protein
LETKIIQLKKEKDELSIEINTLETSRSKKVSGMNRKKADLRYKTSTQYDEMIK